MNILFENGKYSQIHLVFSLLLRYNCRDILHAFSDALSAIPAEKSVQFIRSKRSEFCHVWTNDEQLLLR